MEVCQIAACAENGVIGTQGDLPWDIPEEMAYFRKMTSGHIMIMGRKTFTSFNGKLLPKRFHIVVTRNIAENENSQDPNLKFVKSLDEAYQLASSLVAQTSRWDFQWPQKVFVIGGGEIYRQAIPKTDLIYLTRIHQTYPGDTFFPVGSLSEFKKISAQRVDGNPAFTFEVYQRV